MRLAAWLDRWEARLRRIGERLGWPQRWLTDFATYLEDPRLTLEEFWISYVLRRREANPWFERITTEAEARRFYATEYMLWRNIVHRRHSAWRRVLWTMRRPGVLLEIGCGIAPVSAYCAQSRPDWTYWLYDLDTPHRCYAEWRVGRLVAQASISCTTSGVVTLERLPVIARGVRVITALDVFEHLADPLGMAKAILRTLEPGGSLHWNFAMTDGMGLNFATPAQRGATIDYLTTVLTRVWGDPEDHCVSRG